MTSRIDIYRTANLLVREHGSMAVIHAAMRADEMLENGDLDGRVIWLRIIKAIEELTSTERDDAPLQ